MITGGAAPHILNGWKGGLRGYVLRDAPAPRVDGGTAKLNPYEQVHLELP